MSDPRTMWHVVVDNKVQKSHNVNIDFPSKYVFGASALDATCDLLTSEWQHRHLRIVRLEPLFPELYK